MELPPPLVGLRYHWVLPETLDCLILFRGDEGHFLVVHHCNSLCVLLEGEDTVSQSMQTGLQLRVCRRVKQRPPHDTHSSGERKCWHGVLYKYHDCVSCINCYSVM